jgi:precorrin-6B methylase 1
MVMVAMQCSVVQGNSVHRITAKLGLAWYDISSAGVHKTQKDRRRVLPDDRQRGIIIIRYGLLPEATSERRPPQHVNSFFFIVSSPS